MIKLQKIYSDKRASLIRLIRRVISLSRSHPKAVGLEYLRQLSISRGTSALTYSPTSGTPHVLVSQADGSSMSHVLRTSTRTGEQQRLDGRFASVA